MPRRRSNGDGSIRQRADGRWEARYTLDGKPKSIYRKTQKEVRAALRAALAAAEEAGHRHTAADTVANYLQDWVSGHVRRNTAPGTYARADSAVRRHLAPALGRLRLAEVTPAHIEALITALHAKGLAPGTVWALRSTLAAAFNRAVELDLLAKNPVRPVKTPRPRAHIGPLFDEAETRRFIASLRGHRYEGVYLLCLVLGLRRGEALGLTWDAVGADEIAVVRQLRREPGGLVLRDLKTKARGRRILPLPATVRAALAARRAQEAADRETHAAHWRHDWDAAGLVFRSRHGGPPSVSHVWAAFGRHLAAHGWDRRRIHDLRHNCATLYFGRGVSPKHIQELLGHATLAMTMDTYTHVVPGDLRGLLDTWED